MNKKNKTQTFIRCNLVQATPMTRGAYNKHRGWKVPANENPKDDGFLVVYPDGYQSWCPKARFLEQSFPIEKSDTISPNDIPHWQCMGFDVMTSITAGNKPVTLVQRLHPNGYVDHETATCVDPKNYSERKGCEICAERLDQRMWDRLGFVLAWAKNGLHPVKPRGEDRPEICEWAGPREPVKAKKQKKA